MNADMATEAILLMLDEDEDKKADILDRFDTRGLSDPSVFEDLAEQIAFFLEDEVRADMRFHFIDVSMWKCIVLPYIESADYRSIARTWLSRIAERTIGNVKDNDNGKNGQ